MINLNYKIKKIENKLLYNNNIIYINYINNYLL